MVNTKVDNDIIEAKERQTIDNEQQVGDISIKKVDQDDKKIVLPNVEFIIQSSDNKQYIKVKATALKGDDGNAEGTVTKDDNGWATKVTGK